VFPEALASLSPGPLFRQRGGNVPPGHILGLPQGLQDFGDIGEVSGLSPLAYLWCRYLSSFRWSGHPYEVPEVLKSTGCAPTEHYFSDR